MASKLRLSTLAALLGGVLLGSGCASTLGAAVKLPFQVAGHTLDLAGKTLDVAGKSLDVAGKGVGLAARTGRLAFDAADSRLATAEVGVRVLDHAARGILEAGGESAQRP